MLVESMMYRNPLNIGPEATFLQTQSFMQEHGIRHLPVVDKENRIQGIITDRDLRSAAPSDTASASNQELRYRLRRMRVSDIMTPASKLVTVTPDTIVETAVKLMHDHKFGSLPVVADGKLVGLVTLTDILGFFVDVMGLDVEGTRLTMTMEDVPGQLFSILKVIEKYHVNIISIFSPTSLVNKKRHAVFRIKTQDYEGIVKELARERISNPFSGCVAFSSRQPRISRIGGHSRIGQVGQSRSSQISNDKTSYRQIGRR